MGPFSQVALGWIGRRLLDWGGWLGTALSFVLGVYGALPPSSQELVWLVLTGHWQTITLGMLLPALPLVISQIMSWRTTVRPQIVTPEGERVDPLKDMTTGERATTLRTAARAAKRKPSLLERLTGRAE